MFSSPELQRKTHGPVLSSCFLYGLVFPVLVLDPGSSTYSLSCSFAISVLIILFSDVGLKKSTLSLKHLPGSVARQDDSFHASQISAYRTSLFQVRKKCFNSQDDLPWGTKAGLRSILVPTPLKSLKRGSVYKKACGIIQFLLTSWSWLRKPRWWEAYGNDTQRKKSSSCFGKERGCKYKMGSLYL